MVALCPHFGYNVDEERMDTMKIATSTERLNELFESDPRSNAAIGDILNVSRQAVSAWRQGVRSPNKNVLIKIAEMYNVNLELLMGFDVDRNAEQHSMVIPDSGLFRKIIMAMEPEDYRTVMSIFEKTEIKMRERGEL